MNLKTINEMLEYLNNPLCNKSLKVVKDETPSDFYSEGNQGSERSKTITYSIEEEQEILLQITSSIDSYGDNEQVNKIKFVRTSEINITLL